MGPSAGDVTSLLNRLAGGDREAAAQLVPLVYEELHRLAARSLRREEPGRRLQTTELLHEAYIKLTAQHSAKWENRVQFFAVAAQAMRRILVDHARTQHRIRRGGRQQQVSLDAVMLVAPDRTDEVMAVNESLSRLEKLDSRQSRIVELRYFGGLTVDEVAEVLGVSSKTVTREWNTAKAWLYGDLKERHGDDTGQLEEGKDLI